MAVAWTPCPAFCPSSTKRGPASGSIGRVAIRCGVKGRAGAMPRSDGQRRGPLRHVHLEIVARWLAAALRLQRAVARRRLPAQRAVGQIDARDLAAAAVVAEARALV